MAATLPEQVRDRLLQAIAERGLRPGDQLPTEAEVTAMFGVSRSTVREALRLLERDGLVSRTVYPTTPPSVEYALTDLGHGLAVPLEELTGWAVRHRADVERARREYDRRPAGVDPL